MHGVEGDFPEVAMVDTLVTVHNQIETMNHCYQERLYVSHGAKAVGRQ